MRRRVLVAILTVTAVSIVLFALPLAVVLERFVDQNATLRLERRAVLAARTVPADFATSGDPVELPATAADTTLGLYDRAGRLVAGEGPVAADAVTLAALRNDIRSLETDRSFVVAAPIVNDEALIGAVRAEEDNAVTERRTWLVAGLITALAAGVFAVGAVIAVVVARRLAQPVHRLTTATVAVGEGDFAIEPIPTGIAELDAAGVALRTTARRLERLVERERAFSADASHQLRTPLAGMRTNIETELAYPRPDPTTVLQECLEDIDRLDTTIGQLLAIARTEQAGATTVDVAAVVTAAAEDWRGRFAAAGRPLRLAVDTALPPARGDAPHLRNALDVLLDNALVHGAGEVRLEALATPDAVTTSVSDHGRGFPDPPLGTSGSGAAATTGTVHGLGLPLAERLVDAMAARLVITRRAPHPIITVVMRVAAGDGDGATG